MVKPTQTIRRRLPVNRLSVFDHFVGFVLRGLRELKFLFITAATSMVLLFMCL